MRPCLRRFYDLNLMTRRKHGLIPQPWRFFDNIYRHMLAGGAGYLLLADFQGQTIASDLLLSFKDQLTYKFNASDPAFLHLRPNNLLMWSAIKLGSEKGHRSLDLGRCEDDNEGLRRFKLLWGAEERPLDYFYFPSADAGPTPTRRDDIRRRFLALLVRYAPDRVLEAAGAIFYRNFA